MRTFETGATRDSLENKLDYEGFISPLAMWLFAQYMHKHRVQPDGQIRDSDNWQKGMPRRQYMKSLIRHVFDLWMVWRFGPDLTSHIFWEGRLQELACAAFFNIQGLLHELAVGRDVSE